MFVTFLEVLAFRLGLIGCTSFAIQWMTLSVNMHFFALGNDSVEVCMHVRRIPLPHRHYLRTNVTYRPFRVHQLTSFISLEAKMFPYWGFMVRHQLCCFFIYCVCALFPHFAHLQHCVRVCAPPAPPPPEQRDWVRRSFRYTAKLPSCQDK